MGGTELLDLETVADLDDVKGGVLSDTASSQSYLLGIQAQMGQRQSTFTAISKYSMERSAIQNFRS